METIDSIISWHKSCFLDATLAGQIKKFAEEENEYRKNPNLLELADMFIVACGIARFDSVLSMKYFSRVLRKLNGWKKYRSKNYCGNTAFQCVIDEKMKKNRKRIWDKTDDEVYHHQLGIED